MIFQIKLADQVIEIHSLYENIFKWCEDYILPPSLETDTAFVVKATEEEIEQEDKITQYNGWRINPQRIMVYHPAYLETRVVNRKISEMMPFYSTFLMHGAAVAYDGKAYIFAAPSGIGKTTRAKLWLNEYPGSYIVNGDKPFVKITDKEAVVYGTPWCGKEGFNVNTGVPLQAIFILERDDEGKGNSVVELSFAESFPTLFKQTYHPFNKDAMRKTLRLIQALDGKVKIYRFHSAPTSEAIRLAYETSKPT